MENRWVGFFFLENTVEAITSVYAGTTFSLLSSEGGSPLHNSVIPDETTNP